MRTYSLLLIAVLVLAIGCGAAAPAPQSPTEQPEPTPTSEPPEETTTVEPRCDVPVRSETPAVEPTVTKQPPTIEKLEQPTLQVFGTRQSGTTIRPSDQLEEMTNYWLMAFTHTDPDYLNDAQSGFSLAEDGILCDAARKFYDIFLNARDRDGSRLPAASYNAGVLYLLAADRADSCYSTRENRTAIDYAIESLEYTWRHRSHDGFDNQISLLLGVAWSNAGDARRYKPSDRSEAIPYLCRAGEHEPYKDRAEEILQEIGGSCSR